MGIFRHVDAGYPDARQVARAAAVDIPSRTEEQP
jgi:urocanate hydratase